MELRINGQLVTVPESISTVVELIHHFNLENRMIIVEQNQTILEKQEHEITKVKNGDNIELVQFVGGG
ncbi:sulfur carrier protein ThiS [Rossellomorea aquimaris]|uniref:Sulfur carrier protein n=1 Tax=Rossellomorea aquimaris TaxID=189382 RepID=A0A366F0A8_9BACI|nr:sulfur carrier protein ThiS [Rossellomorea aquimaris]RBP08034.1 sulfur carrier protein [Rossellomorea aquimaris]